MNDRKSDDAVPRPDNRRPDTFHVFVRHDDTTYFLAPDGTFVPDLEKGCAFHDFQDAREVVDGMMKGRNLSRTDEPGVMKNAWKWIEGGTKPSD